MIYTQNKLYKFHENQQLGVWQLRNFVDGLQITSRVQYSSRVPCHLSHAYHVLAFGNLGSHLISCDIQGHLNSKSGSKYVRVNEKRFIVKAYQIKIRLAGKAQIKIVEGSHRDSMQLLKGNFLYNTHSRSLFFKKRKLLIIADNKVHPFFSYQFGCAHRKTFSMEIKRIKVEIVLGRNFRTKCRNSMLRNVTI